MRVFASTSDAKQWLKRKGFPCCTVLIKDKPNRIGAYSYSHFADAMHWAGIVWYLPSPKNFS